MRVQLNELDTTRDSEIDQVIEEVFEPNAQDAFLTARIENNTDQGDYRVPRSPTNKRGTIIDQPTITTMTTHGKDVTVRTKTNNSGAAPADAADVTKLVEAEAATVTKTPPPMKTRTKSREDASDDEEHDDDDEEEDEDDISTTSTVVTEPSRQKTTTTTTTTASKKKKTMPTTAQEQQNQHDDEEDMVLVDANTIGHGTDNRELLQAENSVSESECFD